MICKCDEFFCFPKSIGSTSKPMSLRTEERIAVPAQASITSNEVSFSCKKKIAFPIREYNLQIHSIILLLFCRFIRMFHGMFDRLVIFGVKTFQLLRKRTCKALVFEYLLRIVFVVVFNNTIAWGILRHAVNVISSFVDITNPLFVQNSNWGFGME